MNNFRFCSELNMRYPMTKYARMYIAELSSVKFANELRFQNIKQILSKPNQFIHMNNGMRQRTAENDLYFTKN